jgi:hypothetical protein
LVALPVPASLQGNGREYVLRSARKPDAERAPASAGLARLPKWMLVVAGLALLALGTTFAVRTLAPGALKAPAAVSPASSPSAPTQTPSTGSPPSTRIQDLPLVPAKPSPGQATPVPAPSSAPAPSAAPTEPPRASPTGSPVVTKPTPAASPAVGGRPSNPPFPKGSGPIQGR